MNHKMSGPAPNRQTISEASGWFVSFRFDEVNDEARERFSQWLRRSPEHIQAYLEIAGTWAELPGSDPAGRLDIAALIARARATQGEVVRLEPGTSTAVASTSGPSITGLRRRALLAASVALVVAGGLAAWFGLNGAETYTTGVGVQRSVALADGSVVDLNARTLIRVRFSKSERDVELVEGQGLFHVARDAGRPFVVHSAQTRVRAVGTEFDVYRRREATLVTVLEGRVAIVTDPAAPAPGTGITDQARDPVSQAGPLYLDAGEQAVVTVQATIRPQHADVVAATAWVRQKLVFEATPLSEVVEEFNRYSSRALVVEDAQLGRLGISGIYSSTDPASLLRFLRAQPGIAVVETDKEIRISRASSP
jgi:transmembrane sensor